MKSIADHVREHLSDKPFINDMLVKDLINANALAREIRKNIEAKTGESVSLNSISMAIGRHQKSIRPLSEHEDSSKFIDDVLIQTNIAILNYPTQQSERLLDEIHATLKTNEDFFVLSHGRWHAGVIAKQRVIKSLYKKCLVEDAEITPNLASLTIRLKPNHIDVLGVCAYIIGLLSHNGVNLEEVISTKDELSVVINEQYLELATKVLVSAES